MEMKELYNYRNKWFVLYHKDLYHENPELIGFRDIEEWEKIKKGDLLVYYQSGNRKIMGIYEVIDSGKNIDPDFGTKHTNRFVKGELRHQHKLKLILGLHTKFDTSRAEKLSFHTGLRNPVRWDNKRVFGPINNSDLDVILK